MLRQRVITALVLITLVLLALFSERLIYWQALINVVVFIGFWEWLRFCQLDSKIAQLLAYALFIAVSAMLQLGYLPMTTLIPVSCIVWLLLFVFTLTDKLDFLHQQGLKVAIGIIILATACYSVIELKNLQHGPLWVLCFLFAVFAADIGAYFAGRRFGKTKLAPSISPGKTVEGLLGGLAFALLLLTPVLLLNFSIMHAVLLSATVLVTVLVSVLGDLFESKQKRFAGIKDSSQVLPGHGGVLDRIDSLLSGAPFFAMGLILLGYW